jgi:hypothetical protein
MIALHEQLERRSVAALVPYARNSNTHPEAQLAQLAASFREFGFTIPVLIDEADSIIAGHGRVIVAERLGMPEVSVIVARGWSDAQIRAYVIADNKIPRGSEFDPEILAAELVELQGMGFNLDAVGFNADELLALLTPTPAPEAKIRARRRSRGGPQVELIGEKLDTAVAEIEAARDPAFDADAAPGEWRLFSPSSSWAHAGPILHREQIDLRCKPGEAGSPDVWTANAPGFLKESDTNPLVAGMRAVVAKYQGAGAA